MPSNLENLENLEYSGNLICLGENLEKGILLKLTLENLEISGNFVLEIGSTP